ncbi:hypothetical protein [Sphingomonas sp. RB1R13]|uniref:hypothetical protein n=1 Tax=Sphingomonas sp. RB1R13 TaxID=3096159 RepID=UPI002FC7BCFF
MRFETSEASANAGPGAHLVGEHLLNTSAALQGQWLQRRYGMTRERCMLIAQLAWEASRHG